MNEQEVLEILKLTFAVIISVGPMILAIRLHKKEPKKKNLQKC